MLRVGFAYIWPEKEARLRAWLRELQGRLPEVRETFRRETVRHEQVFIVSAAEGAMLVYVMEAENHAAAKAAYAESPLGIDREHRVVLEECLRERLRIEPLFECLTSEVTGALPTAGSPGTPLLKQQVAGAND